jgi:hypothetical protein
MWVKPQLMVQVHWLGLLYDLGKVVYKKFLNPKYAIDILLRAEIALKSATSLLFSIFTIAVLC